LEATEVVAVISLNFNPLIDYVMHGRSIFRMNAHYIEWVKKVSSCWSINKSH